MPTPNTNFSKFTNQYALSKTLRFALLPQGETARFMQENGLLQADEDRAGDYKQAKKVIDAYHRHFVEGKLAEFSFGDDALEKFAKCFYALQANRSDKGALKKFSEAQKKLREELATHLQRDNFLYAKKGELKNFIRETLPCFLDETNPQIEGVDNPRAIVERFEKWTTYFYGFNENRKNVYTKEAHSTAIAYRVVHENLPRFISNIKRYEKAKELRVVFAGIENPTDKTLDEIFNISYFNQCLTQSGIDGYNAVRGGRGTSATSREQGINEKINLYAQQHPDNKKTILDCKLEKLHKQILSDADRPAFRFDEIKTDKDLCGKIAQTFRVDGDQLFGHDDVDITTQMDCLSKLREFDPARLYLNSKSVSLISKHIFRGWDVIRNSLEYYAEEALGLKTEAKQKPFLEGRGYYSFAEIHDALEMFFNQEHYADAKPEAEIADESNGDALPLSEQKEKALSQPLYAYFSDGCIWKNPDGKDGSRFVPCPVLGEVQTAYADAAPVLEKYKAVGEQKLKADDKEGIPKIKNYLDASRCWRRLQVG